MRPDIFLYFFALCFFPLEVRADCLAPNFFGPSADVETNQQKTTIHYQKSINQWVEGTWGCNDPDLLWQLLSQFSKDLKKMSVSQKQILIKYLPRSFWLDMSLLAPTQVQHDLILLALDDSLYLSHWDVTNFQSDFSTSYSFDEYRNRAIVSLFDQRLRVLEPSMSHLNLVHYWLSKIDDLRQKELLMLEYFGEHRKFFVPVTELTIVFWSLLQTPFARNRLATFLPSNQQIKLRSIDIIYQASQQDQDLKKYNWVLDYLKKNGQQLDGSVVSELLTYAKELDLRVDMVRKKAALEGFQKFNKQPR